jgi:hypothetical protein
MVDINQIPEDDGLSLDKTETEQGATYTFYHP